MKVRLHPLRLLVAWVLSALGADRRGAASSRTSPSTTSSARCSSMAVIAVLNAIVPPVLAAIRLPFTIATTFLLVLVADALMLIAARRR